MIEMALLLAAVAVCAVAKHYHVSLRSAVTWALWLPVAAVMALFHVGMALVTVAWLWHVIAGQP